MKFVEKGFCFFYISYLCVTQIVRNMKKQILLSCALAWAVMAGAETIDITTFQGDFEELKDNIIQFLKKENRVYKK